MSHNVVFLSFFDIISISDNFPTTKLSREFENILRAIGHIPTLVKVVREYGDEGIEVGGNMLNHPHSQMKCHPNHSKKSEIDDILRVNTPNALYHWGSWSWVIHPSQGSDILNVVNEHAQRACEDLFEAESRGLGEIMVSDWSQTLRPLAPSIGLAITNKSWLNCFCVPNKNALTSWPALQHRETGSQFPRR